MKNNTSDLAQRETIRNLLKDLEAKIIENTANGIIGIYDVANIFGIQSGLVAEEIQQYKINIPNLLENIKIEIPIDAVPPKEERH
jgi:hypothetical protein